MTVTVTVLDRGARNAPLSDAYVKCFWGYGLRGIAGLGAELHEGHTDANGVIVFKVKHKTRHYTIHAEKKGYHSEGKRVLGSGSYILPLKPIEERKPSAQSLIKVEKTQEPIVSTASKGFSEEKPLEPQPEIEEAEKAEMLLGIIPYKVLPILAMGIIILILIAMVFD